MTPQQRDTLNRFLAERVMGWELITSQQYPWYERATGSHVYFNHWNPVDSWADCGPLLDKIEEDGYWWDWQRGDEGRYWFAIEKDQDLHEEHGSTRTEALCLAIARCYGWKEDV